MLIYARAVVRSLALATACSPLSRRSLSLWRTASELAMQNSKVDFGADRKL